ncbi:MAG: hypothetical protein ABL884_12555 [Methyloglobulus sp.]
MVKQSMAFPCAVIRRMVRVHHTFGGLRRAQTKVANQNSTKLRG